MTTTKVSNNKTIVLYWVTTSIAFLAFLVPGILNVTHSDHIVNDMKALGYPYYLPSLLGTWKILGAIAIVVPGFRRLKEWAYAGMFFDLTAASYSRISSGGSITEIVIPLLICTMAMVSWASRPTDRKLN